METSRKTEKSYEENLRRLQTIVDSLGSGETDLDTAMALFEEGAKLSHLCYQTLNTAEQKIVELSKLATTDAEVNAGGSTV